MDTVDKRRVEIDSEGIELKGVLSYREGFDTLLVLCHGIPLSSTPDPSDGGYPLLSDSIVRKGYAALFVNFRGTGDSGGDFHIQGWYRDLESEMDFVSAELSDVFRRIFLVGFSAGGAVAVRYVAEHGGVQGLATLAAPARFSRLFIPEGLPGFIDYAKEIGIMRTPGFPADPMSLYEEVKSNEAIDYIERVSPVPLLIVHGVEDEVVAFEDGIELFDAAGEPRELTLLPEGKHRLRKDPRALQKVLEWIDGL